MQDRPLTPIRQRMYELDNHIKRIISETATADGVRYWEAYYRCSVSEIVSRLQSKMKQLQVQSISNSG